MTTKPNKIAPPEPPLPDSISGALATRIWIRCQRPVPAAVGEL